MSTALGSYVMFPNPGYRSPVSLLVRPMTQKWCYWPVTCALIIFDATIIQVYHSIFVDLIGVKVMCAHFAEPQGQQSLIRYRE